MCNQRGRETCASSMNTFVKSPLIGQNILTDKTRLRNFNSHVNNTFSFHFDLFALVSERNLLYVVCYK